MREGRKAFFFEKKKQKTFIRSPAVAPPAQPNVQKFFGSFFQKRTAFFLAFLSLLSPASAQILSVQIKPPSRDFGYFVGDLVVGTAVITVGPDTVLDMRSLPAAGPVTSSTDLRRIDVSEASVAGGRAVTLRAEYQTFSAPEEVSQVAVPGYQLVFMKGGARLTADVPGFGFAASPFRHDLTPIVDLTVLRPDHAAGAVDVSWPRLEMFGGGIVAVLAFLGMVVSGGGVPWRRRNAPFARAARQIRMGGAGREALLALHRALDATAGEPVLADDLEGFLQRHRRFDKLRGELQSFFAVSRQSFFGDRGEGLDGSGEGIVRLSRALARAERGR